MKNKMKNKIVVWLTPPVFAGDAEKTWRANLLNTALIILILFDVMIIIGNLLGGRVPTSIYIVNGIVIITIFLLRQLLFSGRITLAGILIILALFVVVTVTIIILGTVRTPATSVYLLLIVASGLFFGRNGIVISAVSSSLAVLGLILAENASILPPPDYMVNITQWFTYTALFGLSGMLIHLSHQSTFRAIKQQFIEIDARKRIEVVLQESENRYKQLSDLTFEGIILHNNGLILDCNQTFIEMTGYERDEIIGEVITERSIPSKWHDIMHKNIRERSTTPYRMEAIRKDGSLLPVEIEGREVIRNGERIRVAAIRDITERLRIEEVWRRADTILNMSQAAAFLWRNEEGWPVEFVSGNILDLFGCTAEGFISAKRAYADIVHPDDLKRVKEEVTYYSNDEACQQFVHSPYRIISKDGSIKWVDDRTQIRRDEKGRITHYQGIVLDITERIQAQIDREESHAKLNEAQRIAKLGHYVLNVKSGYWTNSNELDVIFGIDETYQRDIAGWMSIIHPDFVETMRTYLQDHVLEQYQPFDQEYKIVDVLTGQEKWVHGLGQLKFDEKHDLFEMFGTIQDITERKQIEQELIRLKEQAEADKRKFRAITNQSTEGITVADLDGNYIFVNPAFCEMMQYSREELLQMTVFDVTAKSQDKTSFSRSKTSEGGVLIEVVLVQRDGTEFISEVVGKKIEFNGQQSVLGIVRNITERVQVEVDLREAKKAAEAANHAKSAFLSNMSHELRTPLNGILGYTQIFKRDVTLTTAQLYGVDIVHRSGEHLLAMINDILDLSKIEADHVELISIQLNFPNFLQVIVHMMQMQAEQKGLTFNYQFAPDLPVIVLADETRLRQILLNLLGNAIKFTEQGGVTFHVQRGRENLSDLIRFEIEDSGVGIPLEQQADIFEPFHQIGDKQAKHEGTGLGLAISQRLVRMMGGDLYVESDTSGSCFWFELSLISVMEPDKDTVQEIRQEIGYTRTTGTAPFRILLVDDFAPNRTVLDVLLTSLGFVISEAASGLEAISQIEQFKPDFIFMDLVMPTMSGLEATRQIRQQLDNHPLPIIALSANLNAGVQQECIAAGCDDFLPKPFEVDVVLEKLQCYLPLQWLYEEEDVQQETREMVLPPSEDVVEMLSLSKYGNVSGLKNCLAELGGGDGQYGLFVAHVAQLVAGYDMRKIQKYLQECLA